MFLKRNLFINEIRYRHTRRDRYGAVEIAGEAGIVLRRYKLVLYSGRRWDNGYIYRRVHLFGRLQNQNNGFGFRRYWARRMMSRGGIALVDNTDSVIDFVSYGGIVTANEGPALGMESRDIGVIEPRYGSRGMSLQLTGTGYKVEHFSWGAPQQNTFGTFNTAQTIQWSE